MRFPATVKKTVLTVLTVLAMASLSGAASAQSDITPPDAAPSIAVETTQLHAFEPTREDAKLEAFIDGIVEAHRREHDIPGVSISVVKDGRVLFAKGYGYADIEAGRRADGEDTLFRIGSVSKTFIWTAAMMLAERGAIDLDADVNAYLKGVRIPEKFGAPVTMNHLMAHRAGFEDSFGVFTIPREDDISLTDALNKNMPKRVFPPGARTSYSNWGSSLATKVIEDVTGESYEDFLFLEILKPLGMSSTMLRGPKTMPEAMRARLSKGYEVKDGAIVEAALMHIGPYASAGAMSTSAQDMARWMLVHMNGGTLDGVRLMSAETHAQIMRRAFDDRPDGADLAHGFFSRRYRGHEHFGHGGATAAFFTYLDIFPALGIGVYVSQNATTDRTLVSDLSYLVVDYMLGGPMPVQAVEDEALIARAAEAAGAYMGNRRSFTQFEKLFALTDAVTVTPTHDGAIVVAANGEDMRYDPLSGAPDVYENRHGGRLVFGRDDKGRVTHYTGSVGVHSYDRIGGLAHPIALNAAFGAAILFSLTTFAGAWRRQGRAVVQSSAGRIIGLFDIAVAVLIFAFAGVMAAMIAAMSSLGVADIASYPLPAMTIFRVVAGVVVLAGVFAVLSLIPAWAMSHWSLWRKGHHTLFAIALGLLAVLLVLWKAVFAPVA